MQGMESPPCAVGPHDVMGQSPQPWFVGLAARPVSEWWPYFEVASPANTALQHSNRGAVFTTNTVLL